MVELLVDLFHVVIETAINIGYSCRLLTNEMEEVFTINDEEEEKVRASIKEAMNRIRSSPMISNSVENSFGADSLTVNMLPNTSRIEDTRTQAVTENGQV